MEGRPSWLSLDGERRPYVLPPDVCQNQFPYLVQAHYQGELPYAVPVDQIEVKNEAEATALMLPKGVFEIRVLNAREELIQNFEAKN